MAKLARPFRLVPVPVPEFDVHAAVAEALERLLVPEEAGGVVWTTLPIGHVKLTGKQADRLAKLRVKTGWGDIIAFWSQRSYLLEIKQPGGVLSRSRIVRRRNGSPRLVVGQRERFPRLEAQGVIIGIAETVAEALALVERWGWPMRGHVAA